MPRMGIGKLLVRFALAHTIVYGELLQEGRWVRKIIAYVHKENKAPEGSSKIFVFSIQEKLCSPLRALLHG
jgi:hypothetical protein